MLNQYKLGQSQKLGFTFENIIRTEVFNLPEQLNDTNIHDIQKNKNNFDKNENCSIKTTGSDTICCGDILRFNDYDFEDKNTIIVIKYNQIGNHKVIECIYEIEYNKECHKQLFGNLPKERIEKYVNNVKSIPTNITSQEAKNKYNYLDEKKKIKFRI